MGQQTNDWYTVAPLTQARLSHFWSQADLADPRGCWTWHGPTANGRPQAHLTRRPVRVRVRAAVVAWRIERGELRGQFLLPVCGNRLCIRPDHHVEAHVGNLPHNSPEARAVRFWAHVGPPSGDNGCREWTASCDPPPGLPYGHTTWAGRGTTAHRVAWMLTHGPIPEGMVVCHSCDNPPCCNIAHLWLGTPAQNSADMVAKGRSFRLSGASHPACSLTPDIVAHIRDAYHLRGESADSLAARLGHHKMTIWKAALGRTYHDLPMPETVRTTRRFGIARGA